MGCDIHGAVEVREYPDSGGWWNRYLDLSGFVGRNYEMFAILFGVRNYSAWTPVAADRGFPDDADYSTKEEYQHWEGDAHSASWVTWAELEAVDENSETPGYDGWVHVYAPNESGTGELEEVMSFGGSSELSDADMRALDAGETITRGKQVYRRQKATFRQSIGSDWKRLFAHMELLAKDFGDENVRAVVWFDN